jgi:hypothetical protein
MSPILPSPHDTPSGPVLVLAVRHRPFEIAVLFAVMFSTIVNLVKGPNQTMSAFNQLIPGYTWVWTIGVLAGASLALVAVIVKTPTCLLLERAGLCLLAALFLAYGVVSILLFGVVGFSGANLLLAFGLAAIFRIFQLTKDIRTLKGISHRLTGPPG